jgi:phosphatidylglycerol:prolipoprotein diacylglycerol transferase
MALVGAILHVNQGGLVVYGSFFGGFLGMLIFARKHRFPLLALCDLAAPSMALGVAIGRIGCLLNGCCYGGLCDHAWAITFPPSSPPYRSQVERGLLYGFSLDADPETQPIVRKVIPGSAADRAGLKPGDVIQGIVDQNSAVHGVNEPQNTDKSNEKIRYTGDAYLALERTLYHEEPLKLRLAAGQMVEIPAVPIPAHSLPVQPAQIFSTIDGLLLCLLLLAFSHFRRRDGEVFALLMSIYPITRFLIEGLRSDEASVFGTGMSISQNVSLILLTCAVALWCYILYQPLGTFSMTPAASSASTASKPSSTRKQK